MRLLVRIPVGLPDSWRSSPMIKPQIMAVPIPSNLIGANNAWISNLYSFL